MAHLVITIGCEYGAKGNMIGRKVAKDLGIKFYDRDTVDKIIKEVGIPKEIMDNDATTDMFTELPSEFHESALLERFHGFIKGWNIPRMNDDLKVNGWALNSEYFCSIMHELRNDSSYRAIVDRLIEVPDGADTRDTEAVKRIATAYLKLLFPYVRQPEDIRTADFNRYCLRRACKMRSIILTQMGIMDIEYAGRDIPQFKVRTIQ